MVQRTIQSVFDDDIGAEIPVGELLDRPDELFHRMRYEITARHVQYHDRYYCPKCKGPIWPSLARGRFFNHYAPADPKCEWYTGKPRAFSEIDRERFGGLLESPLHKRLKKFVYDMAQKDNRFEWAKEDRERITDSESGFWRKPDVSAQFRDREVVFELQLSRTYLKDIVGREEFYRQHAIFMIWVFHGFERFKEYAAAKDIYYANHKNALELDHEAEAASRASGVLKLKAHWLGAVQTRSGDIELGWQSRIIDLDELIWDDKILKPYVVDPETSEFDLLCRIHRDWLSRFQPTWMTRYEKSESWKIRAFQRAWECFSAFMKHQPLPDFQEAQECEFGKVLDQLYAIRNGQQYFGKQNLVAATNSVLEYRRGFTRAIIAVAKGNDRNELLETPSVARKIARNLGIDKQGRGTHQLDAYNPVVKFLFPESIPFLSGASLVSNRGVSQLL